MRKSAAFAGKVHYVGSFPKDDHVRNYYRIIVDGKVSYVYIKVNSGHSDEDS